MHCDVTLTAKEFKAIHNALWELDSVTQTLEDVLKPELFVKLAKAGRTIREGLNGAYEQERADFDRKSKHYDSVKEDLGIRGSEWSCYEAADLNEPHPYTGATVVCYKDHWGDETVRTPINGSTWAALWVAANACIRDSQDEHHVFIERFRPSKEDPTVLFLSTGS